MSTATLSGHRATQARVHLPAWGRWWADVTLDVEATLSGAVTLTLADLTLVGTVASGGAAQGRSVYRIVGGAGGWGRALPARSYANDAGVKAALVLQDAAAAVGETIDPSTLPATRVGPSWAREEGPASWALQVLAPESWYVGEDGVTRLGRRPRVELSVKAARGPIDRARGTVTLATDTIAAVLPGVVVDGLEAVDVVHEVGPTTGLRSTLWAAGVASTSRRLAAWARLLEQLDPCQRYRGVWEYRVVTQEGERLNLQPVRVSLGMPDLLRVPVRPGVAGARADVALGSTVLVSFVNADPGRPVVVGFEAPDGEGFAPTRLDLVGEDDTAVADPNGRVLRWGDIIQLNVAGPIASGPIRPVGGGPAATASRVRA